MRKNISKAIALVIYLYLVTVGLARVIDWLGKADGSFGSNPNGNQTVSNAWQVAGIGDFNGDGRDDILWRNVTGG